MMSDDFNWDDLSDEEVVVPSVRGVAVYMNGDGDIVIRQQSAADADSDDVVVLPVSYADTLIRRVRRLAEEGSEAL